MSLLWFQVVNGLGIGFIYFLLAVGFTIIFGLMGFVNFAHGAFYMIGAYITYAITDFSGNYFIALAVSSLLVGLLGYLLHITLLHRIYALSHQAQIVITFGLALIIQEVIIAIAGPHGHNVPVAQSLSGMLAIGPFFFPHYRLFVIGVTVFLALALWFLIERTNYGAVVRASSESRDMVQLLGINTSRVFAVAIFLGAALAGLAGTLAAPIRGVEPFMGHEALAIAFVVVILGGLGSYTGALLASMIIGIVQSILSGYWPEIARLMIFGTMLLIILVRPHGLMGRT